MPRNGSGVYTLPQPPFVTGTVISSAAVNSDFSDIATALTGSLPRDGQAGMTGAFKAADGSTANPSITFSNEATSGLSRSGAGVISLDILGASIGTFSATGWSGANTGAGATPIGMISDFAGATAPTGWLLCFGQTVSRTTYASLFAVINTIYGSGDGSTTFGLPDLRGVVSYGKADMGGSATTKLTSTYYFTDPTVLGNFGGLQSLGLIAAQIPTLTVNGTASITSITVTSTGTAIGQGVQAQTTGGGVFNFNVPNTYTSVTSVGTGAGTITGSTAGTTGVAFSRITPGIIMNKIIYAGA